MNNSIITRSIDLHLFFMRIMKEHMLFIEAAFTPQNFGLSSNASELRETASNFLSRIVSMANENVSPNLLASEQIITKYTLDAENATSYFTKIPIDTKITEAEYRLKPITNRFIPLNESDIERLNNEAHMIVSNIIAYKTNLLNGVRKCSIFTLNYPLLIEHILREARYYLKKIDELQSPAIALNPNTLIQEEIFWNTIMAEHSMFIRGLLDPTEAELMNISNKFANSFVELTNAAKIAEQSAYDLSLITNKSLEQTLQIKAFKQQGTEGLLTCKIKALILPLLADHVLREANHYINILKMYRN